MLIKTSFWAESNMLYCSVGFVFRSF